MASQSPEKDQLAMVLGTVQLGLPYGIGNRTGLPESSVCDAILTEAWAQGVRWLDTAASYGVSEQRIGEFLQRHPQMNFRIVSKLKSDLNTNDPDGVLCEIAGSVEKLGRPLDGLMLHNATQLSSWNAALGAALKESKRRGWTKALGVSVYTPDEFAAALSIDECEFIQFPLNVFDRRFSDADLLARARKAGKTLFIRSVYLQGLLLMEPDEAASKLPSADRWVRLWREICAQVGRPPAEVAASFVRALVPDAWLVIGGETASQVRESAGFVRAPVLTDAQIEALSAFADVPPAVYDPRRWSK